MQFLSFLLTLILQLNLAQSQKWENQLCLQLILKLSLCVLPKCIPVFGFCPHVETYSSL